ncbi:vitamin D-binding protein [Ahaetulla prasina]|uniref:vitamin D-binding protein n=1 Tax=Ahaetulla prasina TaxID=499056 RepID=UPI002647D33E|nr:vitamin D-binding protein [Ahaetulla prasina]
MKAQVVSLLLLLFTCTHGLQRGKDYFKEKVCNEYNALGETNFRSISIVINSRKYSNATFEQILSLVNNMVDLAKKCCAAGADPDCYENESTAFSEKSCRPDAPFPRHPGIAGCCTEQGLARKLCLAALKHPPKEFPTYVEPPNEEICDVFKRDPQGFEESYLIKFTQQTPSLSFENAISLAEEASEILSKCCASLEENCFQNELKLHIAHICNTACGGNERLRTCCRSKDDLGKYLCIYSLPWDKHSQAPQAPSSVDEGACREDGEVDIYRYIYDMARIYTRAPEALLITLYSASQAATTDCCSLPDPKACFAEKDLKTIATLHALIEKGNEICGEYTDHTYVEFLKRLRANALNLLPPGTLDADDQVSALMEQRTSYVTKCCHLNAPPTYCGIQVKDQVSTICFLADCIENKS